MPHIVLGCLDALMGNATSGKAYELRTATAALKAAHEETPIPGAADLLDAIENWACHGGTYQEGAATQAGDFAKQCKDLMP